MRRDQQSTKPVSTFGAPRVAPGLSNDPVAARTMASMAQRGKVPGYNVPVAGGITPPIPRLDLPAAGSGTMSEQAADQRSPPPTPSFIQPGTVRPGSPPQRQGPPPSRLLPSDTLPPEALKDPEYHEGMGSMYASSNPALAYKYGVIRNGVRIAPQQLQAGTKQGGLSQQTIEGIQAAVDIQKQRESMDSPTAGVEAAAAAGSAGAAARLGQQSDEKPLTPEDRQKIQNSMDDFDFHTLREMMMKDILNNDEQRKLIEGRLEQMDVADYVMNGFVEQEISINSKLRYTFRSLGGHTDLALKRLVVKEMKGFSADDRYILDKYALMSIACVVTRINGVELPDYIDNEGNFDDERFWVKFNKVSRMGLHILASIGINSFWFDIRVRKLCVADKLSFG